MNDTQTAHLAGVFDAAGAVTAHITKRDRYSIGYEFRPLVRVQRPHRHVPLIGKLDEYAEQQSVGGLVEETSSGYEFEVYGPEDISNFLEPLVPYLVTNYEPAQIMLQEIVPAVEDDKHLTKQGFYELVGVVEELRESTARSDSRYTQEYFADEWEGDLKVQN